MQIKVFLFIVTLVWASTAHSSKVSDLFNIKTGNKNGGCTIAHQNAASRWINEVQVLVKRAVEGQHSHRDSMAIRSSN